MTAEFMEIDVGDVKLPTLEQFSAREGLATVKALLAHASVHFDHVVDDLRECERILTVAAQQGVGWHLEIDV